MSRVLVTGATGFVGQAVVPALRAAGHDVIGAVRHPVELGIETRLIGDLGPDTDWHEALKGIEAVVHLAARVHVMRETEPDPHAAFHRVNVAGTAHLAERALRMGVRRFVYLSSIKVNGEGTAPGRPCRAEDAPAPVDPYALSKLESEDAVHAVATATDMDAVILRPPLVYGPGVKGNFLALMKAVRWGWPLPLGATDNRRSLIYLGNLADAVARAVDHPLAASRTYLVRDGEDLSTGDLIRRLAAAMGRPARVPKVPVGLLRLAGRMLGRDGIIERLVGSLEVDDGPIRAELGWQPPFTVDQGLAATADWFLGRKGAEVGRAWYGARP